MEKRRASANYVEEAKSLLLNAAKNRLAEQVREQASSVMLKIKAKVAEIEGRIVKTAMAAFFLAAGAVFLAAGGTFFFIEVVEMPRSAAFLLTGLALIMVGGTIRQSANKTTQRW